MKNRKTMIILCSFLLAVCMFAQSADAITIETVNLSDKPIAINCEITTFRGVTTSGEMKAKCKDTKKSEYAIVNEPKHGTVAFNDDGSFAYTHDGSRTRKDKFTYIVTNDGAVSNEATVKIRIRKPKNKSVYADMTDNSGEYAAMFLKETGAFTGEKYGDSLTFSPDSVVTKSQFYDMCSAVTGQSLKLYSDNPDEEISYGNAAEIIERILSVTNAEPAFAENSENEEIRAMSTLCACGAISYLEISSVSETLTRIDAAKLLTGAAKILENRK